jgi:S-adenosyl-L-methionine hydrolase (adenosine-forming)
MSERTRPRAAGPIVLLTDFGLSDWYVAAMKGAILGLAPEAALVDLTHAIPPGDARRAAFVLAQAWPWFPEGSVFLAVVDPGVGGVRRALAARAAGRAFVGPDNGVLTPALEPDGTEVVELDPARAAPGPLSATFHGRDLFAPAAARLAAGADLSALGPPVSDPVRLAPERPSARGDLLIAHVVYVDRFGNCITDARREDLVAYLAGRAPERLRCRAGHAELAGLATTYSEVPEGSPLAVIGSGERLEIAVRGGHAGVRLGLGPGDPVEIAVAADGETG